MILTLYAIGLISTAGYFAWLLCDTPGDELSVWDYVKAFVLCGMLSVVWPVFWVWIVWDFMADMERDE